MRRNHHQNTWPDARLVAHVKKIAVLRANALGDFIFALPALQSLRMAYPDAELIFLGKPWHAAFLENRPGPVDRVIPVPPTPGVNEPAGPEAQDLGRLASFVAELQAERFDLALQMHGGGRNSNPLLLQMGARVTAGMKTPDAPALDRWIPYFYWQNEIMRLLEVTALVGAPPVSPEPKLEVTAKDLAESCRAVAADGPPLAVLHPGAGDTRRRWPVERFAAVGDALAQAGCRVAVVGVGDEQPIVEQVVAAMQRPAINLVGRLSLSGLAGLLARARVVVANDSGPRHLAEAVGAPTVGIYWCGNVINAGSAFRTRHRPHLSWRLNCPICGQNTIHQRCEHNASFVDEVRTEEVIDSALDLLRLPPQAYE